MRKMGETGRFLKTRRVDANSNHFISNKLLGKLYYSFVGIPLF
jgi:hypothetical protein